MEAENKPPLKRTKRLTSVVWNDFERVRKNDLMVAICKHCNKKLSGSSTSGTSHLRNHLKRCLKKSNHDISQQLHLVREKKKDGTIDVGISKCDTAIGPLDLKFDEGHSRLELKFDQERSRLDLAHMIILHGYPLSMVEHVGFRRFVSNLQPFFQIMSGDGAKAVCMQIYQKQKQKMNEILDKLPGRISLSAELWTSYQDTRFLCLTAYFIDEAWQLQRKILNFIMVDPDTEQALSEAIMTCLTNWNIDRKLFSITVDSCSNNDNAVFRVRDRLSQNRSILRNIQLFHVRCATRILNFIIEDVLEALQEVTHKIRESVRYVKSSEAMQQKFDQMALQVSQKSLLIDSPTQWASTYVMLEAAIDYRGVFSRLQACDPCYLIAPSDVEWERTVALINYLKLVIEVTNVFSGAKYPTANIYFPEICDIHLKLIQLSKSKDSCISSMALKIKDKFDNYWSVSGLTLTVAVVLDPRFKMKLVEYYFQQMFETNAPECIKEVSGGIKDLFHEYSIRSTLTSFEQSLDGQIENSSGLDGILPNVSNEANDRLSGFDKFLHETSSIPHMKTELDKYLEEPIFPRNADFDVLNWWKVNSPKYPILSVMARDILGICVSIADSSAAEFDAGGKVLDMQRSSQSPDVLQAMVCTHDWLGTEFESELAASDSTAPLSVTAK
ncbi:hypothetical protein AQUCO_03900001v1 [Aquilegia coerulea]|uniref:BED-type domain-containing protein n=1 Tax=Aquilegia coerulea TaxID=218851 RepID=A0A2G5CRE3_AQUCA|nr:hypothetical protein AQUCO_03900001v1 [Aquilegia coerulea]PIA33847.1 hypothetical protein AQUCO_03900001v1 [Aquilegia coerulea]PIA33848.1 hypothetical protein AQUCO_03900001v1 [Aquilegia coerulea]PIA33849.1 hypothetical protein AQUCO_03900001v1 [Aquilegia coerulea]